MTRQWRADYAGKKRITPAVAESDWLSDKEATAANKELRAAIQAAKPKGRKRVNSKPVDVGGVRYASGIEAKFVQYIRLGLIPEFKRDAVIRDQPVFILDRDGTKYTADFRINGKTVVEVKSGKNHKTTGQPYAYWQEGARIRFKWARHQNPSTCFQVWVWDKLAAQFVKVEG